MDKFMAQVFGVVAFMVSTLLNLITMGIGCSGMLVGLLVIGLGAAMLGILCGLPVMLLILVA